MCTHWITCKVYYKVFLLVPTYIVHVYMFCSVYVRHMMMYIVQYVLCTCNKTNIFGSLRTLCVDYDSPLYTSLAVIKAMDVVEKHSFNGIKNGGEVVVNTMRP